VFGVGTTGLAVLDRLTVEGMSASDLIAVNTDQEPLDSCPAGTRIHLESKLLRGLGSGGDPERTRAAAEESAGKLRAACENAEVVFIAAGLGGGTGTGIAPVIARAAKETGALVLGFLTLPFDCEGSRRHAIARAGLERFQENADGVICLPNQKIFKLIDENTSLIDTFKLSNSLLAEGARGIWRLLTSKGLIEIQLTDFCELVRGRHAESIFATAEAAGPGRCGGLLAKLASHPMLDDGVLLSESEAILVSVTGGPDLSMLEVNRLMQEIQGRAVKAQVTMGAAIDATFHDRLAVTLIVARKTEQQKAQLIDTETLTKSEDLDTQLITKTESPRHGSRLLPPPPELPQEQMQQMLKRQRGGAGARKNVVKLRQTQLPLEIISKGRFDKSEPTIHKGEDLDVPTYIRRGVSLN
jgi:cell division protein FtsZ